MTKADRIISELMDALELIGREAEKDDASRHYIAGVVNGATTRCNAECHRNRDGYLVVEREPCTQCDGDGFNGTSSESCERCGGSGKEPFNAEPTMQELTAAYRRVVRVANGK